MAEKYKVPSEPEIKGAVEVKHLIMVDVGNNNCKYWVGRVLQSGDFYCEYGRVQDNKGDCRHDYYDFGSVSAASEHLRKKVTEKLRKGYVEQKIVTGVETVSSGRSAPVNGSLKKIATEQIQGDPETKKLISWLAEVNIHQIVANSKIQYNVASGMFTTPLGTLVTADAIDEARRMLNTLAPFVVKRQWDNGQYQRALGDYLQLIPQDVGRTRGWHETFLAAHDALSRQNDLLDSLAASLQAASAQPIQVCSDKGQDKADKVFNVSLNLIPSGDVEWKRIYAKYNNDKGWHSDVKDYNVKQIWRVHITTVRDAFDKYGRPIGNVQELYHGTKASNLLAIMRAGLIIPPSSDPHVCGRMWGDGVYMSSNATKSLRYATNAWSGGGNTSRKFMFLCQAALGRQHIPSSSSYSYHPPKGYDSCWAKPGSSGVQNDEQIVYKTSQVDLAHLIEFTPYGK